jgi:hypothetical protein
MYAFSCKHERHTCMMLTFAYAHIISHFLVSLGVTLCHSVTFLSPFMSLCVHLCHFVSFFICIAILINPIDASYESVSLAHAFHYKRKCRLTPAFLHLSTKPVVQVYQNGYSRSASLLAHNLKATSDKVKFGCTVLLLQPM